MSIGAGPDGVEEIKRHAFFSTIDWNVSTHTHNHTHTSLSFLTESHIHINVTLPASVEDSHLANGWLGDHWPSVLATPAMCVLV